MDHHRANDLGNGPAASGLAALACWQQHLPWRAAWALARRPIALPLRSATGPVVAVSECIWCKQVLGFRSSFMIIPIGWKLMCDDDGGRTRHCPIRWCSCLTQLSTPRQRHSRHALACTAIAAVCSPAYRLARTAQSRYAPFIARRASHARIATSVQRPLPCPGLGVWPWRQFLAGPGGHALVRGRDAGFSGYTLVCSGGRIAQPGAERRAANLAAERHARA